MSELSRETPSSLSSSQLFEFEQKYIQVMEENVQLKNQLEQLTNRITSLENRLPNSNIISPKYFRRAFAVYGHTLVAGFIVAIPIYCLIFIISFIPTMLGN